MVYAAEAAALVASHGPRALVARVEKLALSKVVLFGCAFILMTAMGGWLGDPHAFKCASLLLSLRIFGALGKLPQMNVILNSFVLLVPSVFPLFVLTILLLYFFSVVGMSVYGGLIVQESPELQAAAGNSAGVYYVMNFHTIYTSMYTLCMTIAGNNINTFAATMGAVDHSGGLVLYLFLYLEITLVLVNVLVSFFIDAYCEAAERLASLKKKGNDGGGGGILSAKVHAFLEDGDD